MRVSFVAPTFRPLTCFILFSAQKQLMQIFVAVLLINSILTGYFVSPDETKPSEQIAQKADQQCLLVVTIYIET